MSKTLVKQKKVSDELLTDINYLYNEVFDREQYDEELTKLKIISLCDKFTNIKIHFTQLNNLLIRKHISIDNAISIFIEDIDRLIKTTLNDAETNIIKIYTSLTKSPVYNEIVKTCELIKNIYENLDSIKRDDDQNIKLFNFSSFSVKMVLNTEDEDEFINILNLLYRDVNDISEEIFKPNININKLCEIIEKSLLLISRQVQRCDKAINIIKHSIKLFKENFNSYYKEAKINGNENSIILYFLSDISKMENLRKYKNPASLTREFREIIQFLLKNNKAFNGNSRITNIINSAMKLL